MRCLKLVTTLVACNHGKGYVDPDCAADVGNLAAYQFQDSLILPTPTPVLNVAVFQPVALQDNSRRDCRSNSSVSRNLCHSYVSMRFAISLSTNARRSAGLMVS